MSAAAYPAHLLDIIDGFRRSKVLFTAVRLGVFDACKRRGSPVAAAELLEDLRQATSSDTAPSSVDGLQRLLYACTGLGLLHCSGDKFQLCEPTLQYLCDDSPCPLTGYILHSDAVLYKLWTSLDVSVCTGSESWKHSFGFDRAQVWKHVYKRDADTLRFMNGMHSYAVMCADAVLTAFDLGQFQHVVDLGGATGAHVVHACRLHPTLRGTVLDLPQVVQLAQQHFSTARYIQDRQLAGRVQWVAGDFLDDPSSVPSGDLFILSRILHDWDEPHVQQILSLVHQRLPPGGAMLVMEAVLHDDKAGPPAAVLQDLNMLVGWLGRERTFAEYCELLSAAGFCGMAHKRTGTYLDVILARKPGQA